MKPPRRIRRTQYGYIVRDVYIINDRDEITHTYDQAIKVAVDLLKYDMNGPYARSVNDLERRERLLRHLTRDIAEPLEWTTEPPTVDGWYWVRFAPEPEDVWIDRWDNIRGWHDGISFYEGMVRFGPIEPPEVT